jgi:hypothetical protein
VVEVARDGSRDFLAGLSHEQKSGLKIWRRNVEKADSEVGRSLKALSKGLEQTPANDKRVADDNARLQQALTKSFAEQWNLASKMGIPPPKPDGNSQSGGPKDLRSRTPRDAENENEMNQ